MNEAYLVGAVRTPVGKRNGGLAGVHPADLSAHVMNALIDRTGIDPDAVDDVIWGVVDSVAAQAGDIARTAWLAAGLPESVPGVTLDRQCGSSQQAVHFAAQGVMSGNVDLVVAGGVANMSAIPIGASTNTTFETPFPRAYGADSGSIGWEKRYGNQEVTQFRGAELIAQNWNLDRSDMEAFAIESHTRAFAAIENGWFKAEIAPLAGVENDECPRRTSMEKMASLNPLRPNGRITAALASQIADGSSAVLVASESAVKRHGLTPRARIHHMSVRGDDPVLMLTAPISATQRALKVAGMTIDQMDLIEINEAFASVPLAWIAELKADPQTVNPNGGAIALGHPLGATGTRLMVSMLHELERTGGRYGLQTMCEGGGQANVTIIERLG